MSETSEDAVLPIPTIVVSTQPVQTPLSVDGLKKETIEAMTIVAKDFADHESRLRKLEECPLSRFMCICYCLNTVCHKVCLRCISCTCGWPCRFIYNKWCGCRLSSSALCHKCDNCSNDNDRTIENCMCVEMDYLSECVSSLLCVLY